MYVPNHFREDNTQTLQQYIRDYSFGLLVVADTEGIEANHIPFVLLDDAPGTAGILQCHLARANPAWQRIAQGARVLAVFKGPDAYVSPAWYPSKAESGRVVPTWNYLAVHAEGQARVIQDADWLGHHLHLLTTRHEQGRDTPWSVADAPADYIDRLKSAIVGIEIRLERLTGKLKASQNQPEANRAGVKAGLQRSANPSDNRMSDFIT